jgi:hypothetical protein
MMSPRNGSPFCILFLLIGLAYAGPTAAATLTFQQGDGGAYSETAATRVTIEQGQNWGSHPYLTLYTFDPEVVVVSFVRFPFIFGNAAGQIPPNSVITSATLELTRIIDDKALVELYQVYVDWDEYTITSFSDLAGVDYGPLVASMPYDLAGTVAAADITAVVQAWSSGAANWGILLRPHPGTLQEARYHSDDATEPATRPKLTVEFTPPAVPVASTTWGAIKALYR